MDSEEGLFYIANSEHRHTAEFNRARMRALEAAIWVTCSEHEWKWTHEQQVDMAKFVCEASRLICELETKIDDLEANITQAE